MARIAEHIRQMWAFGHQPKDEVYEPALAAAQPMDRRQALSASEALIGGRLMAEMLVRELGFSAVRASIGRAAGAKLRALCIESQ